MANFNIAYQLVELAEGGYQNYSQDTGNYNSLGIQVGTNWGISAKVYEEWIGRPPTVIDMQTMTQATAISIYKSNFWDPIQGDSIASQKVANIFFDGHVNHGNWGIKMMQEVLGVVKDGIVGPITLNAISERDPNQLVLDYAERRRSFYNWLAENRDGQSIFLNGWLARLEKFVTDRPAASGGILAGMALIYYLINQYG